MRIKAIASLALLGLALAGALEASPAAAKGMGAWPVPGGIAPPGSPFRYQAFSPGHPGEVTVVTRANREGGKVRKWWSLRGGWFVPGVTPSVATGLSADGSRLVLVRQLGHYARRPPDTRLAIMRPQLSLRHAPGTPPADWVDFARLPGEWSLVAISPDGGTLFLSRYRTGVDEIRPGLFEPHAPGTDSLEVRALDTGTGTLRPGRVVDDNGDHVRLEGIAYDQLSAGQGRWTYTLYAGDRRRPFVYALDGVGGRGTRIDLPHLRGLREPYSVHLELEDAGRSLAVVRRWFPNSRQEERTLAIVDTATFKARRPQEQAHTSFLGLGSWLEQAIVRLGRQVGDDGDVARKG